VRIHGKDFKVKAEIRRLGNYSAHADQGELIDWVLERGPVVGGLFLNHGEDDARAMLRDLLVDRGIDGDKVFMPTFDESYTLLAGSPARSAARPEPRIDPSQLQRDWHNDYAAFILRLSDRLQATETPQQRRDLIERLSQVLN
jgi:metallo-beta-lactamase family protein